MAVPKRKTSKARRDKRRAHHALPDINLVECPQCLEMITSHTVCPHCGYYKGRLLLPPREKKKVKT